MYVDLDGFCKNGIKFSDLRVGVGVGEVKGKSRCVWVGKGLGSWGKIRVGGVGVGEVGVGGVGVDGCWCRGGFVGVG